MSADALVLTHALPRAQFLVEQLQAQGKSAFSLGLQKVQLLESGADELKDFIANKLRGQSSQDASKLASSFLDVIVLISPNAAELFWQTVSSISASPALDANFVSPQTVPSAQGPIILCVGQGTRAYLPTQTTFLTIGQFKCPIMVAEQSDADGVLVVLNDLASIKAKHAEGLSQPSPNLNWLVVRGQRGREDWIDQRREKGDQVRVIALYEVLHLQVNKPMQELMEDSFKRSHRLTWVVASTALAEQLNAWITATERTKPGFKNWAKEQKAMAIHANIISNLESNGFVAPKLVGPGVEGILRGLE